MALSGLLAFSVLAVNVLVLGSVTALFLGTRSRDELPYGYASTSLFGVLASTIMFSISGRVTRAREAQGVFLALGVTLLLAVTLLPWAPSGLVHLIYPLALGLSSLVIVQAYGVIHDSLDPGQIKRLLPRVGALGTLGAMGAGAAMAFVAPRFGIMALLGSALAMLCVAALVVRSLVHANMLDRGQSEKPPQPAQHTRLGRVLRDAEALVFRDRLVARFALAQFAIWVASTLARYQFETAIAHDASRDKIAAFLGLFNLASNAAVLLLQTLLEARLLRAFGLGVGLSSTSVVLSLGWPLLLFSSELWLVGALRFLEQTFRFSLARSAEELLLLPLSATKRRKARTLVTVALVPLAVFCAAMLVIALSDLSSRALVMVTWLLALVGLALSSGLRRPYLERLQDALIKPRPSFSLSTSSSRVLRATTLNSEARAALELKMVDAQAERDRQALFAALEQPSAQRLSEVVTALDAPHLSPSACAVLGEWPHEGVVAALVERAASAENQRQRAIALGLLAQLPHGAATRALEQMVSRERHALSLEAVQALLARRVRGESLALASEQLVEVCTVEIRRQKALLELATAKVEGAKMPSYEVARPLFAAEAERAEERVFAWLSLLYPVDALLQVRASLRASDRRAAAFALELMGQLLDVRLFRALESTLERGAGVVPTLSAASVRAHLELLGSPVLSRAGAYLSLSPATAKDSPMALVEIMLLLRPIPLFAELSSQELWALAERVETRKIDPGQLVVQRGDPAAALFVVLSGELTASADRREPVKLTRGECFGQLCLLAGGNYDVTVSALTEGELATVAASDLEELILLSPPLGRGLLKALARGALG